MEDHLKNKNRLEREWEALCSYQAEPGACGVGQSDQNSKRNRSDAVVACESTGSYLYSVGDGLERFRTLQEGRMFADHHVCLY